MPGGVAWPSFVPPALVHDLPAFLCQQMHPTTPTADVAAAGSSAAPATAISGYMCHLGFVPISPCLRLFGLRCSQFVVGHPHRSSPSSTPLNPTHPHLLFHIMPVCTQSSLHSCGHLLPMLSGICCLCTLAALGLCVPTLCTSHLFVALYL